jgi:MFS family permease
MVFASLLMAAGCSLLFLAPMLGMFFIGLTLFEIGKMVTAIGAQSHVADLGSGRDIGLDFGWYGSAVGVGTTLGPFLAGLLIDAIGYRITWAVIATLMLLTGLAFAVLIGPGRFRPPVESASRHHRRRTMRLFDITTLVAILASFIVNFAMGARTTFFPVYVNGLRFGASTIGALMSLRGFTSVLSRLLMRRFLRLCGGRFPLLLISMTSVAIGIALTPFCRGLVSLSLISILVGVGVGFAVPLTMATVSDGVHPDDRGVALGLRLSGNRLASLVNPLFFGLIIQGFGIAQAFWAGGILLLAVMVPIFIWWRQGRLGVDGSARRQS